MTKGIPLVSVVIPTFNRAEAAVSAVRSAIEQEYDRLEIIVVDDASSDDTGRRLVEFHSNVRLIRQCWNRGPSAARNLGIAAAAGEYIAFLDSDDRWAAAKTARQLAFMRQYGYSISCTGFSCIYDTGGPVLRKQRPYGRELGLQDIVWGVYVSPGSTLVATRSLLSSIGGYEESLRRLEDWDLLLRAVAEVGRLGFLDEDLATIKPSDGAPLSVLEDSMKVLQKRATEVLRGRPKLKRHFRAGLTFEMASWYWRKAKRIKGIIWLAKALILAPIENHSIRIILLPWLKDMLLAKR